MEEVYIDPNDHMQYVIWPAASDETPPILMNEILVDAFTVSKEDKTFQWQLICVLWSPMVKMTEHIVVW